jgi:hypothetical protein
MHTKSPLLCSSPEMHTSCRSCWIMVLILPTHLFWESILQTSKIHNLFIPYPNNTYVSTLENYLISLPDFKSPSRFPFSMFYLHCSLQILWLWPPTEIQRHSHFHRLRASLHLQQERTYQQ